MATTRPGSTLVLKYAAGRQRRWSLRRLVRCVATGLVVCLAAAVGAVVALIGWPPEHKAESLCRVEPLGWPGPCVYDAAQEARWDAAVDARAAAMTAPAALAAAAADLQSRKDQAPAHAVTAARLAERVRVARLPGSILVTVECRDEDRSVAAATVNAIRRQAEAGASAPGAPVRVSGSRTYGTLTRRECEWRPPTGGAAVGGMIGAALAFVRRRMGENVR